jgi:hypothetical protein
MDTTAIIQLLLEQGLTLAAVALAIWVAVWKTIPTTTFERIATSRDAREAKRAELELKRMEEARRTEDRLFALSERGTQAITELSVALSDLRRSYTLQAEALQDLSDVQTQQAQLMRECAAELVTLRRRTDHIERLLVGESSGGAEGVLPDTHTTPLPPKRRS